MEKSPAYIDPYSVIPDPQERISERNTIFFNLYRGIALFDFMLACVVAASELIFIALPDTYVAVYNIYNINHEIVKTEFPHQSWLFTSVLILVVFWLIMEGWLYEVLCRGVTQMDSKKLNRWIHIRTVFLLLSIMQTMYRIMERQFCLYDVIYVPIVMYRVLEIIFVKGLTVEIRNSPFQLNV